MEKEQSFQGMLRDHICSYMFLCPSEMSVLFLSCRVIFNKFVIYTYSGDIKNGSHIALAHVCKVQVIKIRPGQAVAMINKMQQLVHDLCFKSHHQLLYDSEVTGSGDTSLELDSSPPGRW